MTSPDPGSGPPDHSPKKDPGHNLPVILAGCLFLAAVAVFLASRCH